MRKMSLAVPSDTQFASGCSSCCCLYSRCHNSLPRSLPMVSKTPCIVLPSAFEKYKGLLILPMKHPSVTSLTSREQKMGSSAWLFTLCWLLFFPASLLFRFSLHTRTVVPQLQTVYDLLGMAVLLILITFSQNSSLQPYPMALSAYENLVLLWSYNHGHFIYRAIIYSYLPILSYYLVYTQDT